MSSQTELFSTYLPPAPEDIQDDSEQRYRNVSPFPTPTQTFADEQHATFIHNHFENSDRIKSYTDSPPITPLYFHTYSNYNNEIIMQPQSYANYGDNNGSFQNEMYGLGLSLNAHSEHTAIKKRKITRDSKVKNTFHDESDKNSDYSPSHDGNADERSTRTYSCSFTSCGRIFTKLGELREHSLTHGSSFQTHTITSDGAFNCTECESTFKRLPDLQRHTRSIHSNFKPFVCPYRCGKAFSRKDALKRHLGCKTNAPCAGLRKDV
jgi:hypothetical protein